MMKRQPLLADLFLARPVPSSAANYEKGFFDSTRAQLLLAKRFVFDENAAKLAGEMIVENPRIIADAQDFAIPAFSQMWIEFPFQPFFTAVNNRETSDNGDTRLGFLFVGKTVRIIVYQDGSWPELSPIEYTIGKPWDSVEEELKFASTAGISRGTIDHLFWGEVYNTLVKDGEDTKESIRALRANNSARITLKPEFANANVDAVNLIIQHHFGDLRNVIAVLLFINKTKKFQTQVEIPSKSGMIRNKSGVMLKHTVVTISSSPKTVLRNLCANPTTWKSLHDCRGHFCHNKIAREADCDHEWVEDTRDPNHPRWVCSCCNGHRWWQHEHKRGKAEIGQVTHEYHVTQ